VPYSRLRFCKAPSCGRGCRRKAVTKRITPSVTYKREYKALYQAIRRCYVPTDKGYRNYGATGIEVNDLLRFGADGLTGVEWLVYHIGRCPPGLSLDRTDPWGNYEIGNLRWASRRVQSTNTRRKNRWGAGVHPAANGNWEMHITIEGKTRRFRGFETQRKAQLAYDHMARELIQREWEAARGER
jgi:hypothetical protein